MGNEYKHSLLQSIPEMLSKYLYFLKRTCRDEIYSPPTLLLLYVVATKLRVTDDTYALWPTCSETVSFSHLCYTAPVAVSFNTSEKQMGI